MANFSFTNSGAVPLPSANPNAVNPFANTSTNPVASALNKMQAPNFSTNAGAKYIPPPVLPTTPLKSTSITHPDGTNVTSTYHPADTEKKSGMIDNTPKVDPGTGQSVVTGSFAPGTPQNTPTGTSTAPAVDSSTTTSTDAKPASGSDLTYPGLIASLVGAGSKTQSQQNQTADQISQLRQNLQNDTGVIQNQPQELNFQTGRINALQTQEAAKEGALQTQLANEIAAGTQNIGALGTAVGAAKPEANAGFFGSPLTGGIAGKGADLMNAAVGQAVQLIKNGASPQDPSVQSLLSPFGAIGQSALTNALGVSGSPSTNSGYNPTTQSASANATAQNVTTTGTNSTQTAATGYATTLPAYQSASTAFSTADKQANNLLATLDKTGINSSNATDYNTAINKLASKLGSTQTTAFTTALTEAQQAYTNLLSSVGASTPTVNGEQATTVLNPSSTPAQIAEAVDKLNEAAYAKLAPQYQQALTYYNQLHGTNESSIPGYPAPTPPTPVSANSPQGPDTSSGNIGKAAAGAVLNIPQDIGGLFDMVMSAF